MQSNDKKMTNYRENILQCTKQNTERNQLFVDVELKASNNNNNKKKKERKDCTYIFGQRKQEYSGKE